MKKYTPVFGPQELFDGAPEDSVIAIKRPFIRGVRSEKIYFFSTTFDAVIVAGSSFNFNNVILKTGEYAERRIIKEPKRWTWEDKKAGRLPEVGSLIMEVESQYGFEFVGVCAGSKRFAVKDVLDGLIYFYNKDVISPIETPAEKAARLKSEWCAKAAKQLKNLEYTSTLTSIYDALLSGELQAPKGE